MLRHGREATITMNEASWNGSEMGGSQKMGLRVSLAWSGWCPISYKNLKSFDSIALASVTEKEQVT